MRYLATATIAILAVSSWEWGLPAALVLSLTFFRQELLDIFRRAQLAHYVLLLDRRLKLSLHATIPYSPARVSWLLFHSGKY